MNTHADKTSENKSRAAAGSLPQIKSNGESAFQFVDNRPGVIAQRALQEMAKNSPKALQLRSLQEMANNSPQAKQAAQLKEREVQTNLMGGGAAHMSLIDGVQNGRLDPVSELVNSGTIQRVPLMLADRPWAEVERLKTTYGANNIISGGLSQIPKEEDLLHGIMQPLGSIGQGAPTPKHLDSARTRRKAQNRAHRSDQDRAEHVLRRDLNEKVKRLSETQQIQAQILPGLAKELWDQNNQIDGLIQKVGMVPGINAKDDWQDRKGRYRNMEKVIKEDKGYLQNIIDNLQTAENPNVNTLKLRQIKNRLARLTSDAARAIKDTRKFKQELALSINWLQSKLGIASEDGETIIQYPNVYIYKRVVGCPFYDNMPFAELNAFTATGTHGKSADGHAVHKKLAGGYAMTFIYKGGKAYVTDHGPKAPGSEKYNWKRGSVGYDSDAEIGSLSDYIQE